MQTDKDKALQELRETYPVQTELYSRLGWIAEADKTIRLLELNPISIYVELFATEEPSMEQEAAQSHHYAVVRECLDEYCPEVVLKNCMLEAFKTFKKVMESQYQAIYSKGKIPERWNKK